jgi:phage FluMu protein Com
VKLCRDTEGVKDMATKVNCPFCTNTRLLDMVSANHAEIQIKCPRCRRTINLTFEKNQIKAKAI